MTAGTIDQSGSATGGSPRLAAEVALALLTVAAIAGFSRLYRDGSFFVPLATLGVAGHILAGACRRWALPPLIVAAIALISGAVLLAWLFFPSSTALGVPTIRTWHLAGAALDQAWDRFSEVVAPAPVLPGFQLAAAVAVWGTAWFADWSAFRLWAAAESVSPAAALFVFGALLGSARNRVWVTVLFGAAVLLFMLLHRIANRECAGSWLASTPTTGRRSLLQVGLVLATVAVVGGAVVGPQLPGAHDKGLLSWRHTGRGDGSRLTVSPLVDIRKRLVNQSDAEVLTVRSSRRAYWRLTSLETFDGRIWSSGGSFARANGHLPRTDPTNGATRPIKQQYSITALDAIWVPSAFEASAVQSDGTRLRWEPDSATLIVDDDRKSSDGITYEVESNAPQLDRETLLRDTSPVPASIRHTYLELPANFNRDANDLGIAIARQYGTPYERALALQNYFRTEFRYDLAVPPGHGEDAIAEFLKSRRGYCEQFAGTYAAVARAAGLPARVAVGFTPGDADPSDPTRYVVRGKHAHAWPEVYFSKIGWVPFEPTPGRGAPGAENYTGVREQQDSRTTAPTTPTSAPSGSPGPSAPATVPRVDPGKSRVDSSNPGGSNRSDPGLLRRPAFVAGLLLAAIGACYVVGALALPTVRARLRRAAATTAAGRVRVAWDESTDAVSLMADTAPRSSETHHEFASRVAAPMGPSSGRHRELAGLAAAASWSPGEPGPEVVERADRLSHDIRRDVDERLGPRRRIARALRPRQAVAAITGRPPHPDG